MKLNLDRVFTEHNLKQITIAQKTGLSTTSISQMRNGKMMPSVDSLMLISEKLNIPIEEFFDTNAGTPEHQTTIFTCPHCGKKIKIDLQPIE